MYESRPDVKLPDGQKYPRIAPILTIQYAFESSRRDLSFETHFGFSIFFSRGRSARPFFFRADFLFRVGGRHFDSENAELAGKPNAALAGKPNTDQSTKDIAFEQVSDLFYLLFMKNSIPQRRIF